MQGSLCRSPRGSTENGEGVKILLMYLSVASILLIVLYGALIMGIVQWLVSR